MKVLTEADTQKQQVSSINLLLEYLAKQQDLDGTLILLNKLVCYVCQPLLNRIIS